MQTRRGFLGILLGLPLAAGLAVRAHAAEDEATQEWKARQQQRMDNRKQWQEQRSQEYQERQQQREQWIQKNADDLRQQQEQRQQWRDQDRQQRLERQERRRDDRQSGSRGTDGQ